MLKRALLRRASQAFVSEAEVEAGAFCLFDAVHAARIPHYFVSDPSAARLAK